MLIRKTPSKNDVSPISDSKTSAETAKTAPIHFQPQLKRHLSCPHNRIQSDAWLVGQGELWRDRFKTIQPLPCILQIPVRGDLQDITVGMAYQTTADLEKRDSQPFHSTVQPVSAPSRPPTKERHNSGAHATRHQPTPVGTKTIGNYIQRCHNLS